MVNRHKESRFLATPEKGEVSALLVRPANASHVLVLGHGAMFGLVIGLSIVGICIWANGVGAMVPLLANRFEIDPALVSAPLISTLVDATGLVIFYSVAIVLLIKLASAGGS